MLGFNKIYFGWFCLLLLVEIVIALYVKDAFFRPYFGDVLVVILVYCFVKSFMKWPVIPVAVGVLLFAFTVELLQYMQLVEKLGWQQSSLARAVLGTSFSWEDLLCYLAGILAVLMLEKWRFFK